MQTYTKIFILSSFYVEIFLFSDDSPQKERCITSGVRKTRCLLWQNGCSSLGGAGFGRTAALFLPPVVSLVAGE